MVALMVVLISVTIPLLSRGESVTSTTHRQLRGEGFRIGSAVPKWESGVLLHLRYETKFADASPNFAAYRADGSALMKTRIWVPDAVVVYLHDATANLDGRIVVAGVAISPQGQRAGFWTPLRAGSEGLIVRTMPLEPERVRLASDGTLWLVGAQASSAAGPGPDHDVIRQYSSAGSMIRTMLARSSFPKGPHPAVDAGDGGVRITANRELVSFYFPRTGDWFDFDATGSLASRLKVTKPEGHRLTGLTDVNGTVVASFSGASGNGCICLLNRRESKWERARTDEDFTAVLGADERAGLLLYVRGRIGGTFATLSPLGR